MTTHKKTFARRAVAGLGVASLGIVGFAGAAFADGEGEGGAELPPIGNIDPAKDGESSLTINKYKGLPLGEDEELDPENALEGVEFTVQRVGVWAGDPLKCEPINLLTNAGWEATLGAVNLTPIPPLVSEDDDAAEGSYCAVGDPIVDETNENGQVVFDELDLGLYYVTETSPGENHIVKPMNPFYVTLPMPVTGDGEPYWEYDVTVNPKNQLGEVPEKTVETQGLVVGSSVDWTITGVVPTLETGAEFTKASIYDNLDSRLSYVSSVLTIDGEQVYPTPDGGTEYVTFENDEGKLTWTFNEDGRLFLDGHPGGKIELVITTTVNQAFDEGEIPNADYGFTFNDTKIPGEKVPYTYVGGLKVLKTDDSDRPLQGAEFQVFERGVDDEGAYVACPATAPTTGAVSTGISGADGKVMWTPPTPASDVLGLWIADSEDGALANPSKDYCLYETKVPAGYTAGTITNPVNITPGEDNIVEITVVNPQVNPPVLPPTGSNGTLIMTVAGLALVGVGAGTVLVARNRRRDDAA